MNKKKALRSSRNRAYYTAQFVKTETNRIAKRAKHMRLYPNDLQAKEIFK